MPLSSAARRPESKLSGRDDCSLLTVCQVANETLVPPLHITTEHDKLIQSLRAQRSNPGATNKISPFAPGLLRHFVPRND
jgi:hypothetical protein